MTEHDMPELDPKLARRIRLVRRDMGDLLFHFTRASEQEKISWTSAHGSTITADNSAYNVLRKILDEETLIGTSKWTYGKNCVCFTEAPITEFNSIFSLVSLAASKQERPRYQPYGIAVDKKWLFQQGGRPVIYDKPGDLDKLPETLKYRFVPFDPATGVDFTWEREWRVPTDKLMLEPKHTLVVVPTADLAFHIVYDFAKIEADWDVEGSQGEQYIAGTFHTPRWLAVSLDIFGVSSLVWTTHFH
ncbi:hypothetical protein ACFLV3_04780 [Chloroflexota bacterium]